MCQISDSLFYGEFVNSNRIIYTPSTFARANLLHLQEIGELTAVKPHVSSRKDLNSYLFFIVKEGEGILTYNGVRRSMMKGECGFINCHTPYAHQSSADNPWTLKWVHFFGPNMAGIYEKYAERGGKFSFCTGHFGEYDELLSKIMDIAKSSSYIRDMQIAEKLMSLLTLLMEESWSFEHEKYLPSNKRDMNDIKLYLDEHYNEKLTLDNLSDIFFINKYYMLRSFKEQFGMTINAYVGQMRITRAKQSLRFSDKSIEQIAVECGMGDANYMIRTFKKIEGITPGEYRKKW